MRPPASPRVSRRALPVIALASVAALVLLVVVLSNALDRGSLATAQAAPTQASRPVTIVWAGDLTLGSSFGNPPEKGWSVLRGVARSLRAADITAVNLEGTLATTGSSKCGAESSGNCFAFRGPPENAVALKRAGVDLVNLANNHAFDFGAPAMGETVRAVRRHGVQVTGRPGEIAVERIEGARVAFVGFASYRWSSPINDLAYAKALVRSADEQADLVVVLFHGGAEGNGATRVPAGNEEAFGELRGDLRAFSRATIDAGADLVLGSGPHVLRGMELYRNRLIAYSLGNLGGYRNFNSSGTSALSGVLQVTLDVDGRALVGRFDSLRLNSLSIPSPDPSRAGAKLVSTLSRQDFGARGVTVRSDGRLLLRGPAVP